MRAPRPQRSREDSPHPPRRLRRLPSPAAVRVLATLLRPDAGRAEVAGHDLAREPAQVRRNIGLTGQQPMVDEQMPPVLGAIAGWNPISATETATRQLFGNPGVELVGASWPAQHALLLAVLWPVAIVAVFLPLAVHRYRSMSR